ncbi:unnamed protein product, partial [Durusdinium trenchii]
MADLNTVYGWLQTGESRFKLDAMSVLHSMSRCPDSVFWTRSSGWTCVTWSPENFSLADYLLQLSLADVIFHYRYPHAVLTAAALLLALSCTGAASAAHGV